MITFNVSTYGATFGSGQVEAVQRANLAAVRDAIDAANAASSGDNVEVVIDDTDVLECYFDPATDTLSRDVGGTITCLGIIKPTNSFTFTFRGLGATSEVSFFPDAPTFTYNVLYIDAYLGARNVTIADLTINGPASFGAEDPTNDYDRYLIKHQGASTTAYARSTITVDSVVTTGVPTGAFNSNSGEVDVVFTGACDMTGLMICCSVFNQGLLDKTLVVESGTYANTYTATAEGVVWYVHHNVAAPAVDDVMFRPGVVMTSAMRYCIYFNGNPATPVPPRVIIDGVIASGADFVQSNALCQTVIRNCTTSLAADDSAFCISFSETEIHDNDITGGQIQSAPGPFGGGISSYQHVHHNTYTDLSSAVTHNFCSFPNGYVHDNVAVGAASSFSFFGATEYAISQPTDEALLEDNHLSGTFGRGFISVGDDSGVIILRRNTVTDTSPFVYGIGALVPPYTLDLLLEDNVTNDNAIQLKDFTDHVVRGSGNTLRTSFPFTFALGAVSIQDIVNKTGVDPVVMASAGILSLNCDYNEVHLSGTATINTLYLANDIDQTNCFAGQYTLHFDAASSTSAAGNINPLTIAPRIPGTFARFDWNSVTQKWDEEVPVANDFVPLPIDVPVDVSAFGPDKTITIVGSWDIEPTTIVEINNEASHNGTWAPLLVSQGSTIKQVSSACRWMRARVEDLRAGQTNPVINVGATDEGCSFLTVVAPTGNGVGVAVDASGLQSFKTMWVGDSFTGVLNLEISTDTAGLYFATLASFYAAGQKNISAVAKWVRLRRTGVSLLNTAAPRVRIGGVAV